AIRKSYIQRIYPDPVKIVLTEPIEDKEILLVVEESENMINFTWDCDTTGVSFKLRMFDYELEASQTFDVGEKTVSLSHNSILIFSLNKHLKW
ncbi:MAG: hypothetical protein LUG98_02600, partial [Tannerellaceae bacterium]|nr:hypothetical protein [Tannerellaceae bacterium]